MSYNFSIFIQNIMKDTHPKGFGMPEIGQRKIWHARESFGMPEIGQGKLWQTRDRPAKALAGKLGHWP
jgi:hypothetical protein